MKRVDLSLVIPANNEAFLKRSLESYGKFFDSPKNKLTVEIIVVFNSSKPKILSVANMYSKAFSFITFIETPYITGKGGAVSLGFSKACGLIVGYLDLDGFIKPSEVIKLYNLLVETKSLNGVIGNREQAKFSIKRSFFFNTFKLINKVLFGLSYKDTQCGLKLFKRGCAKDISKKLSNTGYTFDINLLLIARYLNYKIIEYPVKWSEKFSENIPFIKKSFDIARELADLKLLEISSFIKEKISILTREKANNIGKTKRLRILIFARRDIKHPLMGGSEIYNHEIAKRLAKDCDVTLFTARPANLSNKDNIDGVKIIRKGNFLTVYLHAFFTYIFSLRGKTDFIIDAENGIPFFTPLYSRKPKLMILYHVHRGMWFQEFPFPISSIGYVLETILVPLLYKSTPVITISPSTLDDLRSLGFSDKNIYLSYVGIQKNFIKWNKSKHPLLLYIGRIKEYKRVDIAVKTIKALIKSNKRVRLLIGGTGDYEQRIKNIVECNGLAKYVKMLGFISDKEKLELMNKAWVFLMPSMLEGWGITITEAASCGTPSVGFNVPGVKDSIRNGETGLLANTESGFIANANKLIQDKPLREKMGKNCAVWSKTLSWNTSTLVFKNVINNELNKSSYILSNKTYPWFLSFGLYPNIF